ncbi:hypothetical protein D3C72_1354980 [compost metagenome]
MVLRLGRQVFLNCEEICFTGFFNGIHYGSRATVICCNHQQPVLKLIVQVVYIFSSCVGRFTPVFTLIYFLIYHQAHKLAGSRHKLPWTDCSYRRGSTAVKGRFYHTEIFHLQWHFPSVESTVDNFKVAVASLFNGTEVSYIILIIVLDIIQYIIIILSKIGDLTGYRHVLISFFFTAALCQFMRRIRCCRRVCFGC